LPDSLQRFYGKCPQQGFEKAANGGVLLRSLSFFADLWDLTAHKFVEIPLPVKAGSVSTFARRKSSQVICQKNSDARSTKHHHP